MKQVVRIIGGHYRGKKLYFPDIPNLRPTPSRVRETVFNWLMNDIHDKDCLDAFAGSGALGFEAFSRGAKTVSLVEQSPKALASLKKNLQHFDQSGKKLQLYQMHCIQFLKTTSEMFDIIFLDPPFNSPLLLESVDIINQRHLLQDNGKLYIESPDEVFLPNEKWSKIKHKKSGYVNYALYKKAD